MMQQICAYDQCTGCLACVNVCAHKAITVIKDREGFVHPQIDASRCIDCGLCAKICPVNNHPREQKPLKIMSGWITDEALRKASSSGGAFSAIAIPVLEEGGVVFGAALNDSLQVVHTYVEKKEDLIRLRGSKYVQSYIGDSFRQARDFLRNNRKVLFAGTPCQIAGLKNYLRKDYSNLLTVDLICHGVPSPLIFEDYKRFLEREKHFRITDIQFRQKRYSWIYYNMSVRGITKEHHKEKSYVGKYYEDVWIRGFVRDLFLRPSCHACRFTRLERCSDFTIADWWGYKEGKGESKDFLKKGVSLIFCNTQHGDDYFKSHCAELMTLKFRTEAEALSTNLSLKHAFQAPALRKQFWIDYYQMTFDSVVKKYMYPEKISLGLRLINALPDKIPPFVQWVILGIEDRLLLLGAKFCK